MRPATRAFFAGRLSAFFSRTWPEPEPRGCSGGETARRVLISIISIEKSQEWRQGQLKQASTAGLSLAQAGVPELSPLGRGSQPDPAVLPSFLPESTGPRVASSI
jgi:hypothetical protein